MYAGSEMSIGYNHAIMLNVRSCKNVSVFNVVYSIEFVLLTITTNDGFKMTGPPFIRPTFSITTSSSLLLLPFFRKNH